MASRRDAGSLNADSIPRLPAIAVPRYPTPDSCTPNHTAVPESRRIQKPIRDFPPSSGLSDGGRFLMASTTCRCEIGAPSASAILAASFVIS